MKFFDNYRQRRSSLFRYVLIHEKHKDGAWHFHGFFMGVNPSGLFINKYGYLDFKPYADRFGYISFGRSKEDDEPCLGGECTAGKIQDLKKAASYILKYITKDMLGENGFEMNDHLYFASKGLNRDEVVAVGSSVYSVEQFRKLDYEMYENEYCAKVIVDSRETGLKCITSFEDVHKVGVNIPLSLSDERRKTLVNEYWQILRHKNPHFGSYGLPMAALDALYKVFKSCEVDEVQAMLDAMTIEEIEAIFASAVPAFEQFTYEQLEMRESV